MCHFQPIPCPACLHPSTLPPGYPGDLNDCQACGYAWTRGPVLEISDVHPAEYAARWGDGSTEEGMLYYSCSRSIGAGRVVAQMEEWGKEEWERFAREILRQSREVRAAVLTAEGGVSPEGWELSDAGDLALLARWAYARAKGPQTFVWSGGSGREILRLTEDQVCRCSGGGEQSGNVRAVLAEGAVEWLSEDPDDIRAALRHVGAWDTEELSDDSANRERALWVACCDCSEYPRSYAC